MDTHNSKPYEGSFSILLVYISNYIFNTLSHSSQLSSPYFIFLQFSHTNQKEKMGTATCMEIIIAIFLPPLGVFLKFGCKVEFWLCLILTLFGYLPGILYALYAITKDVE